MQVRALIAAALLAATAFMPSPAQAQQPPSAPPPGAADVVFVQPERFVDAGTDPADARAKLHELRRALQALARQWLSPGRTLAVEVEQVDLAGQVEPALRLPQRLRVLRGGADWPRIDFKYTLSDADGRTLDAGSASLSDPAYLQHPIADTGESLRYERRMLAQWFRSRFAQGKP